MERFEDVEVFSSIKQKNNNQVNNVRHDEQARHVERSVYQRQFRTGAKDPPEACPDQHTEAGHHNRQKEIKVPGRQSQIYVGQDIGNDIGVQFGARSFFSPEDIEQIVFLKTNDDDLARVALLETGDVVALVIHRFVGAGRIFQRGCRGQVKWKIKERLAVLVNRN